MQLYQYDTKWKICQSEWVEKKTQVIRFSDSISNRYVLDQMLCYAMILREEIKRRKKIHFLLMHHAQCTMLFLWIRNRNTRTRTQTQSSQFTEQMNVAFVKL